MCVCACVQVGRWWDDRPPVNSLNSSAALMAARAQGQADSICTNCPGGWLLGASVPCWYASCKMCRERPGTVWFAEHTCTPALLVCFLSCARPFEGVPLPRPGLFLIAPAPFPPHARHLST